MSDINYPTVDIMFIKEQLESCPKFISGSYFKVGSTHNFVKIGKQPLFKRLVIVREDHERQVNYLQSVGIAANYGFLTELMQWLEVNRSWIDGAYSANRP